MPPGPKRSKTLLLVAIVLVAVIGLFALVTSVQNAAQRRAAHDLQNPAPATPLALAAARASYNDHCASCHGSNGDGKGDKAAGLWSKPTDFRKALAMRRRTDGDLYWVTTKGNWPMPAFEDKLSDLERWQLVDYVRTFASDRSASGAPPPPAR
jgi:mono/diheme cytochrome c family protein